MRLALVYPSEDDCAKAVTNEVSCTKIVVISQHALHTKSNVIRLWYIAAQPMCDMWEINDVDGSVNQVLHLIAIAIYRVIPVRGSSTDLSYESKIGYDAYTQSMYEHDWQRRR